MVIALWLAWAGSARSDSFEGLPVVDIEFSPPAQPIPPARLKELVAVREKAPLEAEDVRKSIQQLFATGRYTEIQVDAVRVEGGVKLTFITIVNWFIGPVKVLGVKEPPSPGQLVTATNLVLGEAYSSEKQKAAEENLRRLLADNGLSNAKIEIDTGGHSDTQQIDITFQITPGERAHFGEIQIRGKPDLTVEQVRRITKWSARTRFTQPNVQRGLDRLRRHYQRADDLQAVLRIGEQKFVPGPNRVDVVLEVDPGPRVDVAISSAKLSRKQLRRY